MRREAAEKQQELSRINERLRATHDRNFKGIINDMKNLPLKAKYSKYLTAEILNNEGLEEKKFLSEVIEVMREYYE